MAEFPALNLYTDAFMADTPHMDARATGAYFCLLMASWRTKDGGLPDNEKMLARMARCSARDWKVVREQVMAFWTMCQDGKWRQKRLELERSQARDRSNSASHAAKIKWLKENERRNASASEAHMRNGCADDATTTTTIEEVREEPPIAPPQGGVTTEAVNVNSRRKRADAGTRLDPHWLPSPEDRAYAEQRGLNADVTGEEFRNYWVGIPGARGRKLDWSATFRNRCIQLAGSTSVNGHGPARSHAVGRSKGGRFTDGSVTGALAFLARQRGENLDDE